MGCRHGDSEFHHGESPEFRDKQTGNLVLLTNNDSREPEVGVSRFHPSFSSDGRSGAVFREPPVLSGSTGQEPPVLADSGATHSVSVPAIGLNSLHRHFVLTGVTSALFINGPFHVPIPSRHVVYRCQGAFSSATSRSLQDTPVDRPLGQEESVPLLIHVCLQSNEDSRWVSLNRYANDSRRSPFARVSDSFIRAHTSTSQHHIQRSEGR